MMGLITRLLNRFQRKPDPVMYAGALHQAISSTAHLKATAQSFLAAQQLSTWKAAPPTGPAVLQTPAPKRLLFDKMREVVHHHASGLTGHKVERILMASSTCHTMLKEVGGLSQYAAGTTLFMGVRVEVKDEMEDWILFVFNSGLRAIVNVEDEFGL